MIRKRREAAAEVSQRLLEKTEGDIDLAQLEALHRYLENAKSILERAHQDKSNLQTFLTTLKTPGTSPTAKTIRLRRDQKIVNIQQ